MARQEVAEVVDISSEAELRSLLHSRLKEALGEDYFRMLYPGGKVEEVTHVTGTAPAVGDILYVNWRQRTFKDWGNFRRRRKPGSIPESPTFIPSLLELVISLKREGRVEALKAIIGDAFEEARTWWRMKEKG